MKNLMEFHDNKLKVLLPMKGYSERVPSKNIRLFGGKQLYQYIMNTLLRSPYIDGIYVNTDSVKIAEDVLESFPSRVVIIERPPEVQGDFVSMNTIIEHDLSQVDGEHFLQTHCTNPLLKLGTLNHAAETYFKVLQEGYDSLFTVNRFQSRFYDKDGKALNHNPKEMLRTQDLSPLFKENSNLFIFSRGSFESSESRIGQKPFMYEMSHLESVDIDTEEDFNLAEILLKFYQSPEK